MLLHITLPVWYISIKNPANRVNLSQQHYAVCICEMAVPKFYGTYVFYFGRIAKVLTHIKAIFWGEGYIYLLFPSSI